MSAVARALRALVRAYQTVRAGRPSPCRYLPSCSAYAVEALEVHGAARGSWLAVRRVCRCHPWGGHGWDPVPEPARPAAGGGAARSDRAGSAGVSDPHAPHHLSERTVA